ncbi:MAG: hypothetical protein CV088_20705 [Nitrospira sp. LK70]|nr:hypothetical protein [Nitrospira sp. LK70]
MGKSISWHCLIAFNACWRTRGLRLFVRPIGKEVVASGPSGGYRLARERQEQYEDESILPID